MDKRLLLSPNTPLPITVLDDVQTVRIPLAEHEVPKHIKKRAQVRLGTQVAFHPSPNVGDLHAPFDGTITEISSAFIEITRADNVEGEAVQPVALDALEGLDLNIALKKLGIGVRPFTRPCDLFIINGLNPEPGILFAHELLADYMPTLEAGFKMLQRIAKTKEYVLATARRVNAELPGARTSKVRAVYPISLARPLIRQVTGKEVTGNVTLVRLHSLFLLGLVSENGMPLTQTVFTALGHNFIGPVGTLLTHLLSRFSIEPAPGDSVILGSLMRGCAVSTINRGISKNDQALSLSLKNSMPDLEDNPCINCGACVSVCPMRLRPNMLSRYAEFELYEGCRKEFLEVCIECGLCGFVCPACRPMQQYLRMAKRKLGFSSHQHISGQ